MSKPLKSQSLLLQVGLLTSPCANACASLSSQSLLLQVGLLTDKKSGGSFALPPSQSLLLQVGLLTRRSTSSGSTAGASQSLLLQVGLLTEILAISPHLKSLNPFFFRSVF